MADRRPRRAVDAGVKLHIVDMDEKHGLRSVFRKMLHYAGGNPSWLHKPRPKKSQMHIVRGRSG